jgi:hypothetical protein
MLKNLRVLRLFKWGFHPFKSNLQQELPAGDINELHRDFMSTFPENADFVCNIKRHDLFMNA